MARATGFKFNTLIDQVGVIRKMKFIPKRGMVWVTWFTPKFSYPL